MRTYPFGSPAPDEPSAAVIYRTQADLDAGLAKWQAILRLQDWNIKAVLCRRWDMTSSSNLGSINIDTNKRFAKIRLIDPLDIDPSWDEQDSDHENTLVHELLHIHVDELTILATAEDRDQKAVDRVEERIIEALGPAFVALIRRTAA